MLAPISQVLAVAEENVAVGSVSSVAGTDKEKIFIVDFSGEEYAVSCNGIASVFKLCPLFEIGGVCNADCCAVRSEVYP